MGKVMGTLRGIQMSKATEILTVSLALALAIAVGGIWTVLQQQEEIRALETKVQTGIDELSAERYKAYQETEIRRILVKALVTNPFVNKYERQGEDGASVVTVNRAFEAVTVEIFDCNILYDCPTIQDVTFVEGSYIAIPLTPSN